MNQQVEIYIDELILHGFQPGERYQVAAAVESELYRLFTENGVPASIRQGGNIPSLNAGSFQRNNAPGMQIAGSVYNALANTGKKL